MGFLLVLALLSCTASFVHLASNKTTQGACSPQPCSTICGATTPYDECTQYCTAGGCDTLVCTSSIVNCTQVCTGGGCKLLECNSKRCEQICTGGECNMTCLSNTDECNQHCTAGMHFPVRSRQMLPILHWRRLYSDQGNNGSYEHRR